ncbi:MAG TPA: CHAD domain-containing protein [Candidatus Dormibacteraeota bacterium]|nr:CHAD domain-containing protein [Candidatus Dormibacteraeota bacterium]
MSPGSAFVSEEAASPETLGRAIGHRYRLDADPVRVLRHEWFDTFDWRLHRAGCTLERLVPQGHAQARFLLHDAAGSVLQATPDTRLDSNRRGTVFRLENLVPDGSLQARLAPIVQMRALLKLASVTVEARQFRVLDGQAKTVARMITETLREPDRHLELPNALLSIVPVRGYSSPAADLARHIALETGVVCAPAGWFPFVLAKCSRTPGDYSGQPSWRLSPSMPVSDAVGAVLAGLLEGAVRNLPGVIADVDTEFLHDLRVAVRRARTALKLLGDTLAEERVTQLQGELSWLSDLTAPTRDLDCHLLTLARSESGPDEAAGVDYFRIFLIRRRQRAQRALVRGLRSARWSEAQRRWGDLAAVDGACQDAAHVPAVGLLPIAEVAPIRIRRAFRRARNLGQAITPQSPATELHSLRRRCKELRYLLEFFAPLAEAQALGQVVTQLRALQDALGEFQDTQVQIVAIRTFAIEMLEAGGTPASTFMTMGTAVTMLEARQARARAQFAERFARFDSRSTRKHMASLFLPSPPSDAGLR